MNSVQIYSSLFNEIIMFDLMGEYMNRNEKFKKNWEGIREKGFAKYFLKSTLGSALGAVLGFIIVKLFFNKNPSSIDSYIGIFMGSLLASLINWAIKEEKYKKPK